MTDTTTVHVIGKCPAKGCKNRNRITITGRIMSDRFRTWTSWRLPSTVGALHPDNTCMTNLPVSRAVISKQSFLRDSVTAMTENGFVCADHDAFMKVNAVKGTVNIDRGCDGRCEAATGPNCECACGGQNHGRAYS